MGGGSRTGPGQSWPTVNPKKRPSGRVWRSIQHASRWPVPCDSIRSYEGQTFQQRVDQVKEALSRLERYLQSGTVRLTVGPQGSIAIVGWTGEARGGMVDLCAVRSLMASNSSAFRVALARAEAQSGRKVNLQAV